MATPEVQAFAPVRYCLSMKVRVDYHAPMRSLGMLFLSIAATLVSAPGCVVQQPAPASPTPDTAPDTAPDNAQQRDFAEPPDTNPFDRNNQPPPAGVIEPAAGPVGARVVIMGDFQSAADAANEVWCMFSGAQPTRPSHVSAERITVIVPPGANSGQVQVTLRRRVLWSGTFSVTGEQESNADCGEPPPMMCCKAMTPACMECSRRAREWQQRCGSVD